MEYLKQDCNKTGIFVRRLTYDDSESVHTYLQALSPQSKNRFGPHAFDKDTVMNVLNDAEHMIAYGV